MIARVAAIFLTLSATSASLQAGIWDTVKSVFVTPEEVKPPSIRVLIARDADGALLEVKGPYNIYDPYKNERLGTRFVGKSNLIQPLLGGLKWGEEFPGTYQLVIVPDNQDVTTVVDGIEYRGLIYVYDVGGNISIVNEVDIEDYVNSILSVQFTKPLAKEAMAAAAIAARTDAYHQALSTSNPYWQVDGKATDYLGVGVTQRANGVEQAVAETRYMVMSRTSGYEKTVTPFPVELIGRSKPATKGVSGLSLDLANNMAEKGHHADKILTKVFPGISIGLTHNSN
jgi:stage II sporulation protein D